MQFTRGQKTKLSDLSVGNDLEIALQVATSASLDVSAFGLDANGKLSDDRYFVFYNQKSSPCGGLTQGTPAGGDVGQFSVRLDRLPASIQRIVFTVTIDGAGSLSQIGPSALRLLTGGREVARFAFQGSDFGPEKAVMVAEVYKKDVWRFAANGQGFAGGLQALLESFGGEVAGAAPAAAKPAPAVAAPPVAAPPPAVAAPPVAAAPKINLGKVTLEKRGARQAISLKKGGGPGSGATRFHINLNWDQPGGAKKGGLFGLGGKVPTVDLDLGCMFKLTNGMASCIQPLGGNFGSKTDFPFIFLDKDDRSGAASDGENMTIFNPSIIEKLVVFALIYEGTANFATVNARVTIKDDTGTEILIKLDNPEVGQPFCAAVLIERRDGNLEIVKEERYFSGHRFCDEHFGFGFKWAKGSK